MRYLFDTDHISILQRRSGDAYPNLRSRIAKYSEEDFALSVISFHEQVLGANELITKAKKDSALTYAYQLLNEILSGFALAEVLPFDDAALACFHQLRSQKVRIGTMDLRIASICLTQNLTLLTRNFRDFQQVPGLLMEDWTR
jgi:tRNA(fMet)-specific endonuclease VapC